jgi:hypothetical protein
MPTWLFCSGNGAGFSQGAGQTRWYALGGQFNLVGSRNPAQILIRDSYTASKYAVMVTANGCTGVGGTNFGLRINAGWGVSVNVPALTTGYFEDTVTTDNLVNGDIVSHEVATPAGGTSITFTFLAVMLTTALNTTPILVNGDPDSCIQNQNVTLYYSIEGKCDGEAVEADTQWTFRTTATLSNLAVYISTNGITAASTFRTRVNGANGTQLISIGAGLTGLFEDAVNTDAIAVGNTVSYQLEAGAGGTTIRPTFMQVKSNSAGKQLGLGLASGVSVPFGVTIYGPMGGDLGSYTAVEASVQLTVRTAFSAGHGFANVLNNTLDGATNIRIRVNGGYGNINISIGAGLSGIFEDLVNVDNFAVGNQIDWELKTGGTAGTMGIGLLGLEEGVTAGVSSGASGSNAAAALLLL